MVSSDSVPWYNRPPRPFPARNWLADWVKDRYPFSMPPIVFARLVERRPAGWCVSPPRVFPVKGWQQRQTLGQ
jgi:hypothetical protein